MLVEPAANALITIERARRYVLKDATDTSRDDILQDLINAGSAAIETYCDRKFKSQNHTETHWDVISRIFVRNYPITAITSITEEGITDPIDSNYYKNRETYIQLKSYEVSEGNDVTVVYTGGYADIPEDLQFACCKLIDAYYKADVADYSKMFDGGTVIRPEGIPLQVRVLLDSYKKVGV